MKKVAIAVALCMVLSIVVGGAAFAVKGGGSGAGKAFFYNTVSGF